MEDTSRNVGYHHMVEGVKCYFKEFGFIQWVIKSNKTFWSSRMI